ncbi:MAG: AAA family ATPase [Bryobacteraceae bacterium]|nr:AAA family ATPase [Bryobacteraceae bacterium]
MLQLSIALAISDADLHQALQEALRESPVHLAFEQAGLRDLQAFLDKVERMRPDVVFIDLASLPCDLPMLAEALGQAPGSPFLVVVHGSSDPQLILNALRGGAKEFLCPPFQPMMQTALLRLAGERERVRSEQPARSRGRMVGFLGVKGGCGATTIACHAARELAAATGKKTLLCDLDLQAGLVRFLLQAPSRYSVLDALANTDRLDENFWRAIICNGSGHLEVLAGPDAPPGRDLPSPKELKEVMHFCASVYDWCLFDLGRGLSPLTFAALDRLGDLFLVTTPDVPALHRAKHLRQQLLAHGVNRNGLHLILNRASRRMDLPVPELEGILGQEFYVTVSDCERELREAYSEAKLLPPHSALGADIQRLVQRLAGIPAKKKSGGFSLFG